MKSVLIIMFLAFISPVVQGQEEKSPAAERKTIDSAINVENSKLHIVLSCGPTISKRSAYSGYDSDTLVYASGFLYDTVYKQQYNWRFDYIDAKLVKATVSLGFHPGPSIYNAIYYFRGKELIHVEGENPNYSNKENILKSADNKLWIPIYIK